MKRQWRRICLALFLLSSFAGCGIDSGPTEPGADAPDKRARTEETPAQPPKPSPPAVEDEWQLILFRYPGADKPAKIGHARLLARSLTENGRQLLKRTLRTELSVRRSTSVTSQWMEFTTIEEPEGRLIRFESMMSMGRGTTMSTGRVAGDKLLIETTVTAGATRPQRVKKELEWKEEYRGFFAVNDSLVAKPLKPGEKRTVFMLEATTHQISPVEMVALSNEQVALLDETRAALHVRRSQRVGESELTSHMWCDSDGRILKEAILGSGMEQYLTTKKSALAPWAAPEVDFAKALMIKVPEIPKPHETKQIVFRARLRDKEPVAKYFSQCPSQKVAAEEGGAALVTVRQVRPDTALSDERRPAKEDSAPNSLIQSADERVVEMASEVAPGEKDSWKLACALERHVHERIQLKNFSQAFATAAEVARSLEGDCTEHAVLLAALCRARKIPARVAVGLVYFVERSPEPQPHMAYHMWTEAFIKDRWIPLDATLGRGGIGAAHLKIADSSLAGTSAFGTLLPLMQIANRLELEVVKTQ